MQAPVLVLNTNTKRETGRKAQLANVAAAKAVADIVRTTLGPKSMLKMLLDPMGGIVITNDGNAILREIDVAHPAAKSMLELARSQDEEVGDGTTSVIILAGEMLVVAEPFLQRNMHPTVLVRAYSKALEFALQQAEKMSTKVDLQNKEQMRSLIRSCVATKFSSRYGDLISDLALEAVERVTVIEGSMGAASDGEAAGSSSSSSSSSAMLSTHAASGTAGISAFSTGIRKDIDTKRYAKVEKLPGGELEECRVLDGVMCEKDVTHPKMKRKLENPRIILLDCPLEYKKAESATNLELAKEEDFEAILRQEEEYIAKLCGDILAHKPDLVITEKGVSDLASHYLLKAGVSAIRRVKKMENLRIARAVGATIVSRPDELTEEDVGTRCGLFEIRKFGEEYFMFLEKCKDPKACTIILRGGSRDILNEFERNLQDAIQVARQLAFEPKLLPGGGATEMSLSVALTEKAKTMEGVEAWPFRAVAAALEVIPRTLAQNCGSDVIRVMTELRAKKANGANPNLGIDGTTGLIADMTEKAIWDTFAVRAQVFKSAVESACLLLRIDDILSGIKNKQYGDEKVRQPAEEQEGEGGAGGME